MATEKQSFKDRTIRKILSGTRFVKGSTHSEDSSQPESKSIWYDVDHVPTAESASDSEKEVTRKKHKPDKTKKSKKSVTNTKTVSAWFLQDESPKLETSKKEAVLDPHEPVKLERSGSFGSKRRVQPEGTFEYTVKNMDTLSSIAAHFDVTPSELKKLNKLTSQYIYPGQVLYIPSADKEKSKVQDKDKDTDSDIVIVESPHRDDRPKMDVPLVKMADKPPSKIPGHAERQTPVTSPKEDAEFVIPHKLDEDEIVQLDQDCYERFIKVFCKHITDGQGVVSGVLLVTPNAVMFDPNVSDPLVIEHGADTYGVIAPMDMIISCAMYHDIVAMNMRKQYRNDGENGPKPEIYHDKTCPHYQSWVKGHSQLSLATGSEVKQDKLTSPTGNISDTVSECSCGVDQKLSPQKSPVSNKLLVQEGSPISSNFDIISQSSALGETKDTEFGDFQSSSSCKDSSGVVTDLFNKDSNSINTDNSQNSEKNIVSNLIDFSESDNTLESESRKNENESESKNTDNESESRKDKFFLDDDDDNVFINQKSDKNDNNGKTIQNQQIESDNLDTDKSPSELRIGNIVYMPVSENVEGEVSEKSIEDVKTTLSKLSMDDFESRERTSSAPVDVPVVSMSGKKGKESSGQPKSPKSLGSFSGSLNSISPRINTFVNYATGLFKPDSKAEIKDVSEMPQEESARHFSASGRNLTINMSEHDFAVAVESAVKLADKPELFQSFDKLIPKPAVSYDDPPLYLCIRLGKPIRGEISSTCPIAAYSKQKKKPEYWFSIPREKVDPLYAFFVQWKPEIYGDDDSMMAQNRGFVVLSDDVEETGDIEILDEYFGGGSLQKDWEIISAEEMLKRQSIDEGNLMPELLHKSNILEDFHLEMLSSVMPPRTVGYPWCLIYSTERHGFSLKTMYRHMHNVDSPILIVVKDTNENVFGAMTSCEMKVSDHFYGTGESFLYTFCPEFKVFRWTGENNFFIKGNQESLSIGAGQGQFGLWFDGDIYHGRTNHCETYDNDILTSAEDFVVGCFEAWGFTD